MLSRRGLSSLRVRAGTATVALLLVTPLVAGAAPAAAGGSGTSAIGDGASSNLRDYKAQAADIGDPPGQQTGDPVPVVEPPTQPVDGACQTLTGVPVSPGDIPDQYKTTPPAGKGAWEYQVCATSSEDGETAAEAAQRIVRDHPDLASAKAYCDPRAGHACAVYVYWRPEIQTTPPPNVKDVKGYFTSFFTLAPKLGTSPDNDTVGLLVNFPSWFWNTTYTGPFPKVLPDPIFGGVATAWHLETVWETDGHQFCDNPGTKYTSNYPPGQASPDCGYTYLNIGVYNVHACSTWLIVVANLFFIIVFPITVCNNFNVRVKESQVLTGGDVIGGRVR
jgi:hypothetical protein